MAKVLLQKQDDAFGEGGVLLSPKNICSTLDFAALSSKRSFSSLLI